jgi:hypothetical protein
VLIKFTWELPSSCATIKDIQVLWEIANCIVPVAFFMKNNFAWFPCGAQGEELCTLRGSLQREQVPVLCTSLGLEHWMPQVVREHGSYVTALWGLC